MRNVIEVGRKTHRDVIWHCGCGRIELWKIWGICGKIEKLANEIRFEVIYGYNDETSVERR